MRAMGAGDENFRKKARTRLLKKIQSDQTTVIVSHDLDVLTGSMFPGDLDS